MQIVIDISETAYNYFAQGLRFTDDVEMAIIAIVDGTPLPKGHGDLIDKKEAIISLFDYYNGKKTVGQCIDKIQTIVEADKEVHDADSN